MPLVRPPVPVDSDIIIADRERRKPEDSSTVLAKTKDGVVVQVLNEGFLHTWPDGQKHPYAPWDKPWDQDDAQGKKLKVGIADQFEFRWVNGRNLAQSMAHSRWIPVNPKDCEVYAPFAYGDKTDPNRIQWIDTVLCKREREYGRQVLEGKRAYNDPKRYIANRNEEMSEMAAPYGASNVTQTFELSERDAVTRNAGSD